MGANRIASPSQTTYLVRISELTKKGNPIDMLSGGGVGADNAGTLLGLYSWKANLLVGVLSVLLSCYVRPEGWRLRSARETVLFFTFSQILSQSDILPRHDTSLRGVLLS